MKQKLALLGFAFWPVSPLLASMVKDGKWMQVSVFLVIVLIVGLGSLYAAGAIGGWLLDAITHPKLRCPICKQGMREVCFNCDPLSEDE